MLSDTEIMVRVQAGETSLFAELVHRYRPRLVRFAFSKIGHQSDAEDIVQDALLAAFHSRNSYSAEFSFSTWIWTITLNLTRTSAQRKSRIEVREQTYAGLKANAEHSHSPIQLLMNLERSEQLNEWLIALPEVQADAIRLRFFGDLSFQEIALAMDCSESGAKRRIKIALIKLAEMAAKD